MKTPIPKIEINGNGQYERFRRILFNEVGFLISIIGATVALFLFLSNPAHENMREIEKIKSEMENKQELLTALNKIRDNDLHTLEGKLEDSNKRLNEIENQLIELKAILNERLPVKQ